MASVLGVLRGNVELQAQIASMNYGLELLKAEIRHVIKLKVRTSTCI